MGRKEFVEPLEESRRELMLSSFFFFLNIVRIGGMK